MTAVVAGAAGLRYSVNLSMLFTEFPLLERPARAADAGFGAAEIWWPFATPSPTAQEVDAFVRSVSNAGLTLACLNFDGGDFAAGERGLLSLPTRKADFRACVSIAIEIADALECKRLNALYGNTSPSISAMEQRRTAMANLAFAATAADAIGATVVVEALNATDFPAYGLHTTADSAALIEGLALAGLSVGIQFDVYHVVRGGESVLGSLDAYRALIRHVQIADLPGRGYPGTGDLPFSDIFAALRAIGYDGYVGLEYLPAGSSAESFGWLPAELRGARAPSTSPARKDDQ
jgi:hydroxypyruvate isomerase